MKELQDEDRERILDEVYERLPDLALRLDKGEEYAKNIGEPLTKLDKLSAVQIVPSVYALLSANDRNDRDIAEEALQGDSSLYFYAPEAIQQNRHVALQVAKSSMSWLSDFPDQWRADAEVVLERARHDAKELQRASGELASYFSKDDPVKALEAHIFAEKLTNHFAGKPSQSKPKLKI